MDMKIKPSRQAGHVVFEVGTRDTVLLAHVENVPDVISTVVEDESFSCEQLDERANKITHLLEEILARPQLPTVLEIQSIEFSRGNMADGKRWSA